MMILKKTAIILAVLSLIFLLQVQSLAKDNLAFTEKENAWLNRHHTVRARVGNAPPLHFFDGRYQGISVDYLDLISKRAGFKVQYITDFSWPDALDHIKKHKEVDLLLTAKITPDRKETMAFTDEYLLMPSVIFSRSDEFSISTIEDLAGASVSIEKGYVLFDIISEDYPEINLIVKDTTEKALQALSFGEVDAYIGNLTIGTHIIQQKNLSNVKIAAPTPFENNNQAMAIRSDWSELASIIDKTLNAMKPEEHKAIRSHWLSIRYEYGIQTIDIVKWVSLVLLIAAVIFSIFLFWNRRLQSEIAERKRIYKTLQDRNEYIEAIIENLPIGFAINTIDDGDVKFLNSRFEEIYGWSRDILTNTSIFFEKIFPDPDYRQEMQAKIITDMESGDPTKMRWNDLKIVTSAGEVRYVHAFNIPIIDQNMMISTVQDVTAHKIAEDQIKASLAEKETLLLEIHHRVKNNMQVISSLLSLQADALDDDKMKRVLIDSQNRVKAMAAVHENLYQSKNLSSIKLLPFLRKLINSILASYQLSAEEITAEIKSDEISISIERALPLGLIVNELVSNSLKHAFPEGRLGKIDINSKQLNDQVIQLRFSDNGIGIPLSIDWRNADSLGLKLVTNLAENQLDGSIEMEINAGTHFVVEFEDDHNLTNG